MELLLLIFFVLTAFFFFAIREGSQQTRREDSVKSRSVGSGSTGNRGVAAVTTNAPVAGSVSVRQAVGVIGTLAQAAGLAAAAMAAIAVGTVVIGSMVAAEVIRAGFEEYKRARSGVDARGEQRHREQEIRDINSEIGEYESKRFRDGRLNEYDDRELAELYSRRNNGALQLAQTNEIIMANDVSKGVGAYDNVSVSDANTHILQFHVGQSVFGKSCRLCGMPMVLQWKQRLATVQMSDFFWGCTGFFGRTCRNTERFARSDMTLFTNTDREEFAITATQLTSIASLPQSRQLIRRRMDGIVDVANRSYYCPVHHEPMVLRTKKNPESIRDMYFYGCPRWRPAGPGCNQIVKLKSAAQLSAALETTSGRGFL